MAEPRIAQRGALNFTIGEDGAISNPRIERMTLFMADGVTAPVAWKLLGGKTEGGSHQYRRNMEAHPLFQARLANLLKEKEELMADEVYGEAKWMASQMWREARAKGCATMMTKAAEMRMKILEREDARLNAGGAAAPGKPGKPAVENPTTRADAADMRQRLVNRGVAVPGREAAAPPTAAPAPVPISGLADTSYDADLERALSRA